MAINSKTNRSPPTGANWELTAEDWNTLWDQVQMARAQASGAYGPVADLATVLSTDSITARPLNDRFADTVNVLDFAADPTGVADATTAILAAVAHAKTLTCPTLVIPRGEYLTSDTLEFDLPNGSSIIFGGKIKSSISAGPAIRIGTTATTNSVTKLYVTGLKVERTTTDMDAGGTTSNSTGVSLTNVAQSYVDIRECAGFTDGVLCYGTAANGGFSYNEIHLGRLHDNKRNLTLNASGVGYCNENNFFGGSFNHSSNYPNYTGTVDIQVNHFNDNWLNNNRFFGPSLEGNDAATLAVVMNGDSNAVYHPRLENPDDQDGFAIYFDTNSRYCSVYGVGFDVRRSNITDYGLGNSYEARDGATRKAAADTGATEAVLALQSTVSATAKLLSFRDTAGDEYGYVDGLGRVWLADRGYFANGVRFLSTDGTYNDQGIFIGTGTPEAAVAAQPGSIYVRRDGAAGTNVYAKVTGDGNTGWKPVPTQAAAVADGSTVNQLLAALRASGVIAT